MQFGKLCQIDFLLRMYLETKSKFHFMKLGYRLFHFGNDSHFEPKWEHIVAVPGRNLRLEKSANLPSLVDLLDLCLQAGNTPVPELDDNGSGRSVPLEKITQCAEQFLGNLNLDSFGRDH